MFLNKIGLQFFAEGAGAAPAATDGNNPSTEATPQEATAGNANAQAQTQAKPTFEDLLKDEEYRKVYDKRVSAAIRSRFKSVDKERAEFEPVLMRLGKHYGIDTSDMSKFDRKALFEKVMGDDGLIADEADAMGLTPEAYRKLEQADQVLAQRAAQERQETELKNYNAAVAEAEEVKKMFPNFDLETEMQDEAFGLQLVFNQSAGVDNPVRRAYVATHSDEIMSGAMQYAVQKTRENVAQTIQSGMNRPTEGGAKPSAKSSIDPRTMTDKELRDIAERVKRGEKVYLD